MRPLQGKLRAVDRLVFAPDGRHLALAGGNRKPLELWQVGAQTYTRFHGLATAGNRWPLTFTDTGHTLVVAHDEELIAQRYEPADASPRWRVVPQEHSVIAALDAAPIGFVVVGFAFQRLNRTGYQVWDTSDPAGPMRRAAGAGDPDRQCRAVTVLPPGDRFVAAEDDPAAGVGGLVVFDTATAARRHTVPAGPRPLWQLAATAGGLPLWTAGWHWCGTPATSADRPSP